MNRHVNLIIAAILFLQTIYSTLRIAPLDEKWVRLSDPVAPVTVQIALATSDPSVMYAFSEHMIYRTQNGGESWVSVQQNTWGFKSLVVDPGNANLLYAVAENLYSSTDGGATWAVNPNLNWMYAGNVQSPVAGSIYVFTEGGNVARSVDYGAHWDYFIIPYINDPAFLSNVFINPMDSNHILSRFTGWSHQSYVSRDGGLTWTQTLLIDHLAFDTNKSSKIYAATRVTKFSEQILKYSEDYGITWTVCAPLPAGFYELEYSNGSVYAAGIDFWTSTPSMYRSFDGCRSWWRSEALLPPISRITADPLQDGRVIITGQHRFGIFESIDGGATWQSKSNGLQQAAKIEKIQTDPFQSDHLVGILGEGAVYESFDGGQTWQTNLKIQFQVNDVLFSTTAPGRYWVLTDYKIYQFDPSVDQLKLIFETEKGILSHDAHSAVRAVVNTGALSNQFALLDWQPGSRYFPEYWYYAPLPDGIVYNTLSINPMNEDIILLGGPSDYFGGSTIIRSLDHGLTFEQILELPDFELQQLTFSDVQNGVAYAIGVKSVLRSVDFGATWHDWSDGLPVTKLEQTKLVVDGFNKAWMATTNGVYSRSLFDGGWELAEFQGVLVTDLALQNGSKRKLLAATAEGIWAYEMRDVSKQWFPVVMHAK